MYHYCSSLPEDKQQRTARRTWVSFPSPMGPVALLPAPVDDKPQRSANAACISAQAVLMLCCVAMETHRFSENTIRSLLIHHPTQDMPQTAFPLLSLPWRFLPAFL